MQPDSSTNTLTRNKKSTHSVPGTEKNINLKRHEEGINRFAVTIDISPEEAYKFFRDFNNLPLFMKDLKSINVKSSTRSHWVVEIKSGVKADWDAEITKEVPGQTIEWKSVDGSKIDTSGTVWFTPARRSEGTVVSLNIEYKIPGGKLTELATMLSGEDPGTLIQINLRRLKALLETGEIPTTEGQPSGRDSNAEMIIKH